MSHCEFLIALGNIIVDKVATVPTARNRKIDTSAPMEIGLAAKDDGESAREKGQQRIADLPLQAVYKGTGRRKRVGVGTKKGSKEEKVAKMVKKNPWQKGNGKKGSKGQEKSDKRETRACWSWKDRSHIAAWCRKGGNKKLYAIEDDSENNEEHLHAWYLLEESENEQCQEVISRRNTQKAKKVNQASPLSVETDNNSSSMKIIEVKDRWVKVESPCTLEPRTM